MVRIKTNSLITPLKININYQEDADVDSKGYLGGKRLWAANLPIAGTGCFDGDCDIYQTSQQIGFAFEYQVNS